MLGGAVITYPWIGGPAILGHCIAEALGLKWNVPHGVACGVVLPYILQFNLPACTERLAYVSKQVLGDEVYGLGQREAAYAFIYATKALMEDMELPTDLKQLNIPSVELGEFGEYVYKERQHTYGLPRFNPRKLTHDNMMELMQFMCDGTLLW